MIRSFLLILTVLTVAADGTFSQPCEHTDLSRKYNYVTSTVKAKSANSDQEEISEVHLKIVSKATKKRIQEIVVKPVKPRGLFDEFTDCSAVRSYITGKNKNAEAADNDYGDFIVADLNFDYREDVAVKADSGGNGGPVYEFYTQEKSGRFRIDSFLSHKMGFFPGTIDTRRRRLITYSHADVGHYWEDIFKLNPATGKWIALKPKYRRNY